MEPEIGKTYTITHERKGRFALRITEVTPATLTGEIVEGATIVLVAANRRTVGESVILRRSLIRSVIEVTT